MLPFTFDNFMAVIDFYFFKVGVVNWGVTTAEEQFQQIRFLSLNEFLLIGKTASDNIEFFRRGVGAYGMTISNIIGYGCDAILDKEVSGSAERKRLTMEFRQLIVASFGQD